MKNSTVAQFLREQHGLKLGKEEIEIVSRFAVLGYIPHEPMERRALDIREYSNGSVEITSIKFSNVFHFPQSKFQVSLISMVSGVAGIFSGNPVLAILGMLSLISEFIEKTAKEFKEQDAQVLYTIYKLGKICHVRAIPPEFHSLFGKQISEDQLRESINLLGTFRTIKIRENNEVELIEDIHITRQ